jgi:hypothetical protein
MATARACASRRSRRAPALTRQRARARADASRCPRNRPHRRGGAVCGGPAPVPPHQQLSAGRRPQEAAHAVRGCGGGARAAMRFASSSLDASALLRRLRAAGRRCWR